MCQSSSMGSIKLNAGPTFADCWRAAFGCLEKTVVQLPRALLSVLVREATGAGA